MPGSIVQRLAALFCAGGVAFAKIYATMPDTDLIIAIAYGGFPEFYTDSCINDAVYYNF
jgi:hypothetical protein